MSNQERGMSKGMHIGVVFCLAVLALAGRSPAADTGEVEQPFFGADCVSGRIVVRNGSTVLLGGATSATKFGRSTYVFMTVRFIGADGLPVVAREGGR